MPYGRAWRSRSELDGLTAALYVLGASLILQVADVTFPGFGIPDAAIQALVWTAVLGFPVALVFGWLFETGPAVSGARICR